MTRKHQMKSISILCISIALIQSIKIKIFFFVILFKSISQLFSQYLPAQTHIYEETKKQTRAGIHI
jgi:hypothetical protein